jgi:arylsulfatase A-like enzyme
MKQMNRRSFLKQFSAGFVAAGLASCNLNSPRAQAATAKRPNIILIMSDDMGFSDIGCYGGEIKTPNLDHLAYNGLRFTQFYNTARCCPTRASLLTGLYQHQAGIGHMMSDNKLKGYRGDLNKNCMTIAEVMKTANYKTYMSGKWHVTPYRPNQTSKHNWPLQRGFDRFFGTIHGAGSFYDPNSLTRDNEFIVPDKDFYYTDAISDNAVQFIKDNPADKPFFMYVAYTAAHWPMHAKPEDIVKYKGRYDKGWDALRKERYERMIQMGLIDPQWKLTERDTQVPKWEDADLKEWYARRMEVYAAMVDCMDQGIGRIVDSLKAKGIFENTLIFFLQDNGGCAEERGSRGPVKPDPTKPVEIKPMQPGELQTAMQPEVTRDGRPVRTGRGIMPGPADTYIAYGKPWANASNTPFRLYKHWVHEGGIATPLIVHWPAGIKSKGNFRRQPGHLIDIMATCVDVADARYPKEYKGNSIIPMEGKSLTPAFDANETIEREALYWEHEGNCAIRIGKWKLVSRAGRNLRTVDGVKQNWELYDLDADRSETNDLVEKYPERAKQMADQWKVWAQRAHVLPWPWNPKPKPNKKKKKQKQ